MTPILDIFLWDNSLLIVSSSKLSEKNDIMRGTFGHSSKTMFVSRNSLFEKSFSKFSCVYLSLEKLMNGKHFPINGKHFPVNGNIFRSTENTFQSKKNLVWFPGKCFFFWLCLFSRKWFPGNHFPNFPVFVCH
jgi:hypothetical protein